MIGRSLSVSTDTLVKILSELLVQPPFKLTLNRFFPWKILLGRGGGGVSQCRENREEKRGVNVKEKGGKGKMADKRVKYKQKETNKAIGFPRRTCLRHLRGGKWYSREWE
jgi:hypothetical protein